MDSLLIEETPLDSAIDEGLELTLIKSESIQNRVEGYQRPKAIGKFGDAPFQEFKGRRCSYDSGFSLHERVKSLARNKEALEKLCRYVTRGAVAKERISLNDKGQVLLKLKTPYADGTTHYEFTPEQLIKRLIALIPPPRQNFIRYFGILGARHKNRKKILSTFRPQKKETKNCHLWNTLGRIDEKSVQI